MTGRERLAGAPRQVDELQQHRQRRGLHRRPEQGHDHLGRLNIYPTEVEQAIYAHPAVYEACMAGVPDQTCGKR